jgi:hypothetical protein
MTPAEGNSKDVRYARCCRPALPLFKTSSRPMPATRRSGKAAEPSLLAGLLVDAQGERLTSSHAVKKGRHYRYYVSAALITAPLGRYECRVGITALHRLRGVGKTALTMTWVTTSGRTGCRGLQGFLFQVDVSEIVVHEGDEPDALVGNRHDLA